MSETNDRADQERNRNLEAHSKDEREGSAGRYACIGHRASNSRWREDCADCQFHSLNRMLAKVSEEVSELSKLVRRESANRQAHTLHVGRDGDNTVTARATSNPRTVEQWEVGGPEAEDFIGWLLTRFSGLCWGESDYTMVIERRPAPESDPRSGHPD